MNDIERPAVIVNSCPACQLPVGLVGRRWGRCNACGEPLCAAPIETENEWEARKASG